MGYDITMNNPSTNTRIHIDPLPKSSIFKRVGCNESEFWITIGYIYDEFFGEVIENYDKMYFIHQKTGKELLPIIDNAIEKLGVALTPYEVTKGNAGHALLTLKYFCESFPEGVFILECC